VPALASIDVIRGAVTGPVPGRDADVFTAPNTRVVQSYDVRGRSGEIVLTLRQRQTSSSTRQAMS